MHACGGPDLPACHRPGQSPADRLLRVKPGCAGRATGARGRSPGTGTREAGLDPSSPARCPWGGSAADGKSATGRALPWCAGGGSSPRARGAHQIGVPEPRGPGIIPACAGSTDLPPADWGPHRDHPRVRGEHDTVWYDVPTGQGSSPRARGALGAPRGLPLGAGIIPACAGSTSTAFTSTTGRRDHPRVRGEHKHRVYFNHWPQGSSPRARGAPHRVLVPGRVAGIIPACAGSTPGTATPGRAAWDHPRVRGEH